MFGFLFVDVILLYNGVHAVLYGYDFVRFELSCVLIHALDAEQPFLGFTVEHQVLVMVTTFRIVLILATTTLTVVLSARIMAQFATVLFTVERDLWSF